MSHGISLVVESASMHIHDGVKIRGQGHVVEDRNHQGHKAARAQSSKGAGPSPPDLHHCLPSLEFIFNKARYCTHGMSALWVTLIPSTFCPLCRIPREARVLLHQTAPSLDLPQHHQLTHVDCALCACALWMLRICTLCDCAHRALRSGFCTLQPSRAGSLFCHSAVPGPPHHNNIDCTLGALCPSWLHTLVYTPFCFFAPCAVRHIYQAAATGEMAKETQKAPSLA